MRGVVAKRIRRIAREQASSNPTEYKVRWFARLTGKTGSDGKPVKDYRGTVYSTGYRHIYQHLKKDYLNARS